MQKGLCDLHRLRALRLVLRADRPGDHVSYPQLRDRSLLRATSNFCPRGQSPQNKFCSPALAEGERNVRVGGVAGPGGGTKHQHGVPRNPMALPGAGRARAGGSSTSPCCRAISERFKPYGAWKCLDVWMTLVVPKAVSRNRVQVAAEGRRPEATARWASWRGREDEGSLPGTPRRRVVLIKMRESRWPSAAGASLGRRSNGECREWRGG